ncbi:cytochrome P450 [Streptomyces sp. SID13031]|uniref:cytochrome P450 n=1 Tax=Streptomyces sp. SID13031 TaxID=2706046 RepID=UPI0013CA5ED0|nr:cytochrome P450 [Streptomyces sp. SID13031]NEA33593.1 cytochrome P450 [Streptomyces sp. SID13031]
MTAVFDYRAARGGATPFGPPLRYAQLRDEQPISQITLWDGSKAWFLTRQQDVRAALADERISADNSRPGFPLVSPGSEELTAHNPTIVRMDPPEHSRQRAMVTGDYTHKAVSRIRPQIQQVVDRLVDSMVAKHPPADLVVEFAQPLAAEVTCMSLGIPFPGQDFFRRVSSTIPNHYAGQDKLDAANDELTQFLTDLVEHKAGQPGDDLLSRLVAERSGELTRDEIIAMARLLLVGNYDPAATAIAMGIAALFFHPEQLAALRHDPSLISNGLDELLRYMTIHHTGLPRVAVEDTEIGGQSIKAGEAVLCYLPAANFDPEWFESPETLDLRRGSSGNVSLGYGIHRCLGQHLAKLEMEVAIDTLIRRIPNLRLAVELDEVRFSQETALYGVSELPVSW